MSKRIVALLVFMTLLIGIFILPACTAQRRPDTTPAPNEVTPAPDSAMQRRADNLAVKISQMEMVNSATVVIAGTRAWVGVDLKADTTMTNNLKNEIAMMVKEEEPTINTVYVTADADTVTRLRNISRDIAAGRPVSGFIDELEEIGRRITPSMD